MSEGGEVKLLGIITAPWKTFKVESSIFRMSKGCRLREGLKK